MQLETERLANMRNCMVPIVQKLVFKSISNRTELSLWMAQGINVPDSKVMPSVL